jgi:hypothetical protein
VSTNSIVFNSTLPIGAESQLYKSKKSRKSSSTGLSMFLFLLKAIGVLAFCAFAFSAYVSETKLPSRRFTDGHSTVPLSIHTADL